MDRQAFVQHRHILGRDAVATAATPATSVLISLRRIGKWWVAWSRNIGSGVSPYQQLFQRHTLLGVQGTTRITTTPFNVTDRNPTLSYHAGTVTLIWSRISNPTSTETCDLRVARSHGGAWASAALATQGTCNDGADSIDYNGVVYATWIQRPPGGGGQ